MLIFKDVDPFYLKSLIFIFKDDKYQKRFIEILYFSILLIIDNIKSGKIIIKFLIIMMKYWI